MKRFIASVLFLLVFSNPGYSWLYPEHRDIMIRAIEKLTPDHRKLLEELWSKVRLGHESRLSVSVIDTVQGVSPAYLDYGAWPAISGDHSCSPQNLTDIVMNSEWIIEVASITAVLKEKLAHANSDLEKESAMREADLRLLRADQEYASRAGGNYAHFKLALKDANISATNYMADCLKEDTPLNISGIYIWFHESALKMASVYNNRNLTDQEKAGIALSILADEAFALHFLEDCFASGHVAGIWGDASQRKGTHDYYNSAGLLVSTWQGERMVLMGDAYMRQQDEERCANTVKISLDQLLNEIETPFETQNPNLQPGSAAPDTFNVCSNMNMAGRKFESYSVELAQKVLATTPVPGLASGAGALPRISTELGPFIGFATGVRGTIIGNGFSTYQKTAGYVPGLEISFRIGLGLEGLLNESSDGLTFLDLGWRLDGASTIKLEDDSTLKQLGSFASALPGRDAYFLRLRLPFYLIPGDLLVLAPVLFLTSGKTLNKVVSTAGNGGLIPWQRKMISSVGSFQFILGREVGISFYGYGNEPDVFFMSYNDDGSGVFCGMRTTQLNFPILEYKLVRSYGSRQSADVFLQFYAGIDIPGKRRNIYPSDAPFPPVQNIYFVGLRAVFDYRHYFGGRK